MQARARWIVTLCLVLVLAAAVPILAARGGKQDAAISCTQAGYEVDSVVAGSQFAIQGQGFTPDRVVLVCFSGEYCRYSTVSDSGTFDQSRTIAESGRYTVTVHESRNQKLDRSVLRVSSEMTITEAY